MRRLYVSRPFVGLILALAVVYAIVWLVGMTGTMEDHP